MNNPKLLIILNRLVIGGQALDNIPLAYYLQKQYDILIIHGKKENDENNADYFLQKYPGLKLKYVPEMRRSILPGVDRKAYKEIRKIIQVFNPDIVHTHGAKPGFLGRLAAKKENVSVIVHTYHGHLFHSYFNKFFTQLLIIWEKYLASKTTAIITLSQSQKTDIEKKLGLRNSDKVKIVPLGIDYITKENTQNIRESFRAQYFLNEDELAVGIVGRIVPVKNVTFFAQVINTLIKIYPEKKIRFFIVGDGNDKINVLKYCNEHNIDYAFTPSKVTLNFTSWVQDINNIIHGLDVLCVTSFNEGTPLSSIEAQLAGKPVIAVNAGGVKDTFQENISGFLVADHKPEIFASKIAELYDDKNKYNEMSKAASIFAENKYSKQAEVQNMLHLYQDLLINNIRK